MTANEYGVMWWADEKCSGLVMDGCITLWIYKNYQLYTLKGWILWHLNYISIQFLKILWEKLLGLSKMVYNHKIDLSSDFFSFFSFCFRCLSYLDGNPPQVLNIKIVQLLGDIIRNIWDFRALHFWLQIPVLPVTSHVCSQTNFLTSLSFIAFICKIMLLTCLEELLWQQNMGGGRGKGKENA